LHQADDVAVDVFDRGDQLAAADIGHVLYGFAGAPSSMWTGKTTMEDPRS
jgi:hypothetical protein